MPLTLPKKPSDLGGNCWPAAAEELTEEEAPEDPADPEAALEEAAALEGALKDPDDPEELSTFDEPLALATAWLLPLP